VPQVAPEAPHPRQQQAHDEGGEHEPAGQPPEVGAFPEQPELGDDLHVRLGDHVVGADDGLVLEDRHADGLDQLGEPLLLRVRPLLAERRVGDDERADDLRRQPALRRRQPSADPVDQVLADLGHLAVAQLAALDRAEDALGLHPDERPARRVERDEGLARLVR
jgi:hypothetical protein